MVLVHAFHPQVVYDCIGVTDEVALGSFLDGLPNDETYLDKFDYSLVNSVQCKSNNDYSMAATTVANFNALKVNLQSLKKRDLKAAKKVQERVSNFDLGSVFTKRVMNDYNHIKHRYTSMELRE